MRASVRPYDALDIEGLSCNTKRLCSHTNQQDDTAEKERSDSQSPFCSTGETGSAAHQPHQVRCRHLPVKLASDMVKKRHSQHASAGVRACSKTPSQNTLRSLSRRHPPKKQDQDWLQQPQHYACCTCPHCLSKSHQYLQDTPMHGSAQHKEYLLRLLLNDWFSDNACYCLIILICSAQASEAPGACNFTPMFA